VTWDYSAEELAIIRDNTVDELGINLYYPHRVKARRAPGIRRRRSIRLIMSL
jgi:beta-glucosidase/6-phospho-beta-glucosidase/beta-galactosidase